MSHMAWVSHIQLFIEHLRKACDRTFVMECWWDKVLGGYRFNLHLVEISDSVPNDESMAFYPSKGMKVIRIETGAFYEDLFKGFGGSLPACKYETIVRDVVRWFEKYVPTK